MEVFVAVVGDCWPSPFEVLVLLGVFSLCVLLRFFAAVGGPLSLCCVPSTYCLRILADRLPTTSPCCLPWTEGPVNSGRFCPVSPSSRRRMARTLRAAPLQHGRPGSSRWHVNPFLCLNLSVTSWLLSFFSGLLELPFAAVFGWKFDEVVQELDHSGFQVQEVSSPTLQLRANL